MQCPPCSKTWHRCPSGHPSQRQTAPPPCLRQGRPRHSRVVSTQAGGQADGQPKQGGGWVGRVAGREGAGSRTQRLGRGASQGAQEPGPRGGEPAPRRRCLLGGCRSQGPAPGPRARQGGGLRGAGARAKQLGRGRGREGATATIPQPEAGAAHWVTMWCGVVWCGMPQPLWPGRPCLRTCLRRAQQQRRRRRRRGPP